jgi:hypothetical protein
MATVMPEYGSGTVKYERLNDHATRSKTRPEAGFRYPKVGERVSLERGNPTINFESEAGASRLARYSLTRRVPDRRSRLNHPAISHWRSWSV